MATVCAECSILVGAATALGIFFLTRIYTFKFKLMASFALSIWFSQSADETLLPLKEIGVFLQTSAEARQEETEDQGRS